MEGGTAADLKHAAEKLEDCRQARDRLIVDLYERGYSQRRLATLAKLSQPAVAKVITRFSEETDAA